jgi:hypothetical protein
MRRTAEISHPSESEHGEEPVRLSVQFYFALATGAKQKKDKPGFE